MTSQHNAPESGAEQAGASGTRSPQAGATRSGATTRAPVQAAFGNGSGAAIVFRDYASI